MAHTVCAHFTKLLERINQKHATDLHQFKYKLVNPKWSSNDESPNSAIEVMHLMDEYDGNPSSLDNMLLHEDHVRVALKVAYVGDLVMSSVNVCRQSMLGKIPRYIEDKCNNVLQPTREVVQYRQVCGWLAEA